jgi:hypothetical protein
LECSFIEEISRKILDKAKPPLGLRKSLGVCSC